MKAQQHQRGYLLITVVVALFLLATVAVLLTQESAISANTASAELDTARADYVAKAGMQHALWRAQNNACMGDATIPATALGADSYTATITGASAGTAFVVSADQDAWIRSDDVTKNNGTAVDQHIRFESGKSEHVLTRFDLSSLPGSAQINSATAWFYVTGSGSHPEGPVSVYRLTADWTETGATWATMNGKFDDSALATIPAQPDDGTWISFSLTGQVQAWVNGQPNYGILFATGFEGVHGKYSSREDGGNAPYLDVVVGSGAASPVAIQATGTLASGVSRTISQPLAAAWQPPIVHTFSPGALDSEDAEIWDQAPNNNYGNAAETWVSSASNDETRTLLRFNMGAIPAGARILQATLSLQRQSGAGADQPVSAHRILNAWSEDAVSWNDRLAATSWDTAGADFEALPLATTPIGSANQRYEWNITPLAQAWVDGSHPNYGVVLVAAVAGMTGERFYTSDQSDFDRRPALTVSYACECGTACMAPQGSGTVLLVRNKNSPDPTDTIKQATLEGWGYQVDLIDDWASQTDYNTAMANSDVVFISGASPFAVGSKLNNAPIGIVNERGELNGELGIATADASPIGDAVDVVDVSHYITSVFPGGPLQLTTAKIELATVGGTVAPGAQHLAQIGAAGALVAIDAGATLSSGGAAAARRVALPAGASDVDWMMTGAGQLVIQRSIAWAMNADNSSSANLLMVVVDPSSLTGQEQAKKSLIESWGFAVNLIDQSDNQASFDSSLADNDVVFIGEDVTANNVGTKLTAATIGVVTEEDNLSDELGFGDGIDWNSGTDLKIYNSHYITEPLPEGDVTVLTTWESFATLTGTIAPDIDVLGTTPDGYALVQMDAGAQMRDGGTAAGRRVMLPWGGNDMDVNHLNANGLTLFKRALEWGANVSVGGKNILLIVADPGSPSAQDSKKQVLIEGWGYTVTLIDDDDSQANLDTALAESDVAYISEGVDPAAIGSKLNDATIGLVNEKNMLRIELGFSGDVDGDAQTDIDIVDTTHSITSGFSAGPMTIVTSSQALTFINNGAAPGAQILAEANQVSSFYEPSLLTLEKDSELWGGGFAAGRRVSLPWGGSGFDVDALNTDGRTIMRRAIEWAAESGASTGPVAHWKMDDAVGTAAIDSVGGHHGTLINGPAWTVGKLDGGLSLDGSNDYVDVSSLNPRSYDDMTISAWYRSADSGVSDDEYIFEHNQNFTNELTFGPTDDGTDDRLRFGFANGGSGTWDPHYGTSDIVDQEWHHVVGVRVAGRIKLYVDGNLETDEADAHAGTTVSIDGDGPFIGDLPGNTEQVHGIVDDVRLYDRGLSDAEIAELYDEGAESNFGGGGGAAYTDLYQEWQASSDDTWQTVDLSSFGVPANAVVEVAVTNSATGSERWGGVRAAGSSLDRRIRLHEAESGGVDAVVMHAQANTSGEIQHYSDRKAELKFTLLGYWTGASYVELFDPFTANDDGTWVTEDVSVDGLGPNQIAEIAILNESSSAERAAGVRAVGSGVDRRLYVHEAESGGVDAISMMVQTDAASKLQVYAQDDEQVEFVVLGYWATPPGSYTETLLDIGGPGSDGQWQTTSLASHGVPGNAVVQITMANEATGTENRMGARAIGSSLNRTIDLQEPENGGNDLATLHVPVDGSSQLQWQHEDVSDSHRFYVSGWWLPN